MTITHSISTTAPGNPSVVFCYKRLVLVRTCVTIDVQVRICVCVCVCVGGGGGVAKGVGALMTWKYLQENLIPILLYLNKIYLIAMITNVILTISIALVNLIICWILWYLSTVQYNAKGAMLLKVVKGKSKLTFIKYLNVCCFIHSSMKPLEWSTV